MPRISVLIPTHEHTSTLRYAVRSVQTQGIDDLEILICGDGVSNELRAVITELQRADPRIRFFDLPKAPCRGELNRDYVMRQAKGQIICHQNDDDLWLPGHIEMLERALEDADFVAAMQVNVGTDGKVRAYYFDLERPEFVEPWLNWKPNNFGSWACNGFGPIFVAHRLDAFLRVPEGWTTTPVGLPADQVMWHKFLRQPWCRAKFLRWPIALHFPSPDRRDWTPEQRAEELRHWTEIIESPDYAVRIWRDVMPDLGDRLLCQSLNAACGRKEFITRIRGLEAEVAAVTDAAATQIADFQRVFGATREAADERIRQLENQLDALTRAAAAQVLELQTMFDAERSAASDRICELERVLIAEKAAAVARIRELEMIIAARERVFDATREAADERIRQLENQLDALTRAAAAQVLELQTMFDAERSAATDRIRELERVLIAEKAAAVARIRELEMIITAREAAAHEAALMRDRTAEFERNAMLSSTSWRITAPLRRTVDWLRRFRPG